MNTYFAELLKLAKAATKGDWIAVGTEVENADDLLPDICSTKDRPHGLPDSDLQQCADAAYIAAANPKTIVHLIGQIQALNQIISDSLPMRGTLKKMGCKLACAAPDQSQRVPEPQAGASGSASAENGSKAPKSKGA